MGGREQDRRVRRTRKRLQAALAQLLREKKLKDITVRELTELADVNRGTFYSHYRDLYDMREQMEREVLEQLSEVLAAYDAESAQGKLMPILTAVFSFVLDNQEVFATILGHGDEELFFSRLRRLIYDRYQQAWDGLYDLGGSGDTSYCLEFVVGGVVGLVQAWVRSGMRERAESMAALAQRMIQEGLPQRERPQ